MTDVYPKISVKMDGKYLMDRIDPLLKIGQKKRTGSSYFSIRDTTDVATLPLLKDTVSSEREALLIKKLQQCSIIFNFDEPLEDIKGKEIKRECLSEIDEYISTTKNVFTITVYSEFMKMVSINIFRIFPPLELVQFDPDVDQAYHEPSWPHLRLVYEVFIHALESPEFQPHLAKKYLDQRFVVRLLELFDAEDERERDMLKMCLHRVYGKFIGLRPFLRKGISDIFLTFIYEKEDFNGCAELLEICGSIINGFALPLKIEHRQFLQKVLIPLHKTTQLDRYHAQLAYCVVLFLEKEPDLAEDVIKGLLRYWPKTSSRKEVMFLCETEELLEIIHVTRYPKFMRPMFRQIARCILSSNYQVAERVLYIWNNATIVRSMSAHIIVIMPILFPALYRMTKENTSEAILALVYQALKLLSDMNRNLFDELTVNIENEQKKINKKEKEREELWKNLEMFERSKTGSKSP